MHHQCDMMAFPHLPLHFPLNHKAQGSVLIDLSLVLCFPYQDMRMGTESKLNLPRYGKRQVSLP